MRRLLRPRSRIPFGLRPTTKFDEATGQVYTESTAEIQCSDDRDWTNWLYHQHALRSQPTADTTQADISEGDNIRVGSRSLLETAIRCILRNVVDLTFEMVDSLPITVRFQLWDAIKKRNAVSFNTWKLFSQSLSRHRAEPDLFDFSCAIKQPKSLLQVYTSPLASKQCQFLTSLSISTDMSTSELAKLSELSNLVVLELIRPNDSQNPFGLGDRLVRDWQTAVLTDGAFPVLRYLRLWSFEEVTNRSLVYIDAFPALAVFEIGSCSINHKLPAPSGWTQILEENPSRVLAGASFDRNQHLYRQLTAASQGLSHVPEDLSYEPAKFEAHQPAAHTTPNEFNSCDGIRFIPREDMPSFWNQPAPAAWLKRKSMLDSESDWKVDSWEKNTHNLCPIVGDIRTDADLARAGFDTRGQAVIGNALANSVPVISIRLGGKYEIRGSSSRVSYIRTELLYPLNTRVPPADGDKTGKDGTRSTGLPSARGRNHARGVMSSKKRKLSEMLDSFF